MSQVSQQQIEERAAEARNLLNNPVLLDALENAKREQLQVLIQADVGSLTASTAHATVKALDGVLQQLQVFVNEATMQKRKL